MYQHVRYGVALTVALLSLPAHAGVQAQLDDLTPGAVYQLPPEPVPSLTLSVPGVTVVCQPGTVIDGGGQGNAVTIAAEGITLRGCTIRNWGKDLNALDAGVFVARRARGGGH